MTYFGGVADCVYEVNEQDPFRYGDIGVLLGKAIRENNALNGVRRYQAAETIRATVVGAGTHATTVSGSTIRYDQKTLPLKNVPVLRISEEDEASLETLKSSVRSQLPLYQPEGRDRADCDLSDRRETHQFCSSSRIGGSNYRMCEGGDRRPLPADRGRRERYRQGAG